MAHFEMLTSTDLSPILAQRMYYEQVDLVLWFRWGLYLFAGFFGVFPLIVAYVVLAERKIAARFQDRIGPNRVGPFGLLQPFADFIKLIIKESIVPKGANSFVHILAPILTLISAFLVLAVIPFGIGLAPVDLPSGLLYMVSVSSIAALSIFLAGWSSRNKYSLLGAMRGVAQLVSYEIPQVMSVLPVILWSGSLSLVSIVQTQQYDQGWFLFSPPGILGFFLLLISSIAEVNRAPFDLPEAESEIIAGFHTEYSGMRFGLFFLGEYLNVFAICCLSTTLFLGGGSLPFQGLFAGKAEHMLAAPFDATVQSTIKLNAHHEFPENPSTGFKIQIKNAAGDIQVFQVSHRVGNDLVLMANRPVEFKASVNSIVSAAARPSYATPWHISNLVMIPVFFAKVFFLIFVMFWIRATLPRVRVDRLMSFAWKTMVPLAIANIFVATIWFEIVIRPAGGISNRVIGWLITGLLTAGAVALVFRLNRNSYKANDPERRPTLISRSGESLLAATTQGL